MIKDYRTHIYKNFAEHLEEVSITKNFDKEKFLINKYFKKNYLPHFPSDKSASIIDIGCGRGAYLSACIENGYTNVIGIDLSESNVDFCKSYGIPCEQADALDHLNTPTPHKYDVIIFNDVIEHLTKNEIFDMIYAMRNALNENGIVITKTANLANPFTGPAGRYLDFTHEVGFTEKSLKQVFKALEFSDVNVYKAKIYVKNNPIFWLAALLEMFFSGIFYLFCCLYGRFSIKIFTKNIICVARK